MDKDTDASGSNNGSTSTAVARSSTPSSDKVRLEGKAITPLPESEIHIPRFGIRKSKPINPSLDSGTPKRRLADKELFNARTAGLQNIRPLKGNILSSGQGGNSLLSDLDNTARISDVGTRRLSTGKHRKSSRSHWLPTLREIKQKTEQATSGGRLKRMSHSDQVRVLGQNLERDASLSHCPERAVQSCFASPLCCAPLNVRRLALPSRLYISYRLSRSPGIHALLSYRGSRRR